MTLDMDYVEWLARLVMDNADSPNFVFGPLDQKRLAGALLSILPVVRAAERWHKSNAPWPHYEARPLDPYEHPAHDEQDLHDAIDAMRNAPPHSKRGGRNE